MAAADLASGRLLIVGLGNPGPKYDQTRHNIGFDVARGIAAFAGIALGERSFDAIAGSGQLCGRPATILLPQSYMNRSGFSVQAAAHFYRIPPAGIIVLHDDIDLDAGRVRLKCGGGHGGHNGLRSIDQQLGSREYFRVRLGVGRPPAGADVAGWVLSRFVKADAAAVEELERTGLDAVELLIQRGLTEAQNVIHARGPAAS